MAREKGQELFELKNVFFSLVNEVPYLFKNSSPFSFVVLERNTGEPFFLLDRKMSGRRKTNLFL